jgi:hypothetical protein
MPFSTANVCISSPRHQRESSDHSRIIDTIAIATVHLPPPDVRVTYWGFDFAVSRRSVRVVYRAPGQEF